MSQKKVNPFSAYYKTITNSELIIILDNKSKYQQEAVDAANEEFNNRQLSEIEISEARQIVLAKHAEEVRQKEKINAIKEKIINRGSFLAEAINPIQKEKPTAEKLVLTVTVAYSLLILINIVADFRLNLYYARDILKFPLDSLLVLVPLILLIAGTILFWKRKTFGWILLSIFATWSTIQSIWHMGQVMNTPNYGENFEFIFPGPSPLVILTKIVFYAGTLFVLAKPALREIYHVSKSKMIATLVIYSFIFLFIHMMLYY